MPSASQIWKIRAETAAQQVVGLKQANNSNRSNNLEAFGNRPRPTRLRAGPDRQNRYSGVPRVSELGSAAPKSANNCLG